MNSTPYCGLVNICKLPGLSSHDVVYRVRRLAGMKRVGHTGTLDPAACGVLPLCLGHATRLVDFITTGPKTYRAEFMLGVSTDSGDVMGEVTGRMAAGHLREEEILAAMRRFTGTFQQRPPLHSAVWIGGQRAYDLARRGQEVELPLREVTVYDFTAVRICPGVSPRLLADVTCSRGFYLRSLAVDLGEVLGVGATLTFLARTAVGACRLEDAVTLRELAEATDTGEFARYLLPPDTALTHIPVLTLPPGSERFTAGTDVPAPVPPGIYRVYLRETFLGLGRVADEMAHVIVNMFPR